MSVTSQILQIFKSRNNILDILKDRDFDISSYEKSTISEVHTMFKHEQLDMLIHKNDKSSKIYIKYHLGKSLRPTNIFDYVEDLFTGNVLETKDELFVIALDEPNDTIKKTLQQLWEQDNIFINVINIKRLQFNILKHVLVPKHRVLTEDEKSEIMKKYNITNISMFPDISRFSPVAVVLGIRPKQLCEITRPSRTAIYSNFYRICSP